LIVPFAAMALFQRRQRRFQTHRRRPIAQPHAEGRQWPGGGPCLESGKHGQRAAARLQAREGLKFGCGRGRAHAENAAIVLRFALISQRRLGADALQVADGLRLDGPAGRRG
jgi:hypothetical protein